MAVRAFDISDVSTIPRSVVERLPRPRHDARRQRHRYVVAGVSAVIIPFVVALVLVGAGH